MKILDAETMSKEEYFESGYRKAVKNHGEGSFVANMWLNELRRVREGLDKKSVAETFSKRPLD